MTRCINLDWLEVFCFEIGEPHDADFFRRAGFVVDEREYGTRIYNQMFTLMGDDGHPLLEVRRHLNHSSCHNKQLTCVWSIGRATSTTQLT